MTQEELAQILRRHGKSVSTQGDEVIIQTCVLCGNQNNNLELNVEKGVFSCWACRKSGTVQQFLSDYLGYDARVPVNVENTSNTPTKLKTVALGAGFKSARNQGSAKVWLEKRGIKVSDINTYGIKVCVDEGHDHYNRIVFPIQEYWTGKVIGYTSREYLGRPNRAKYLHELKVKTSAGYRISGCRMHVCVEGIIDGIRVHQTGCNAHVLLGSGSNDRVVEWASTLPQEETVVLLLDGDEVGQKRSEALKHIMSTVRDEPEVLSLPEGTDPADFDPKVLKRFIQEKI